jgi:hypothetical protein
MKATAKNFILDHTEDGIELSFEPEMMTFEDDDEMARVMTFMDQAAVQMWVGNICPYCDDQGCDYCQ